MSSLVQSLLLVCVFTGSHIALAAKKTEPPAEDLEITEEAGQQVSAETLLYSVVKVTNDVVDIFSPEKQSGHGTGFFIGHHAVTGKGLIFTNNHVVGSKGLQVQRLTVEFNTDQTRGETIPVELLYQSPIHDFAVLQFDTAALKRANLQFPMRIPAMDSPFMDFVRHARMLRGHPVMAIGNPFDGSNVTTYGQITGLNISPAQGPFIQTQTPINPGNSGGPLISIETGEVVGINTAKLTGADNVGYAIPIGQVAKEFMLWLQQTEKGLRPSAADKRILPFNAEVLGEDTLKVLGLYVQIQKIIPDFFENHRSALIVTGTDEDSGLERDDLLLKINGEIIGGLPYNLFKRLQRAKELAEVVVLRKGQVVTVKVNFANASAFMRRKDIDFVYLSGLLLQEMPPGMADGMHPGLESRVAIGDVIESAETKFLAMSLPPPGSVIVSLNFDSEDYPVRTLLDVKRVLNANRNKPYVRVRLYRANLAMTDEGVGPITSPMTGLPLLDGRLSTYIIPMREVLTPMQFSLHKFRKQFSFSPGDAHTWDWRAFRNVDRLPSHCITLLSGKDSKK